MTSTTSNGQPDTLNELDLSQRFVFLRADAEAAWKDNLERVVRRACAALAIRPRGVHSLRATAARAFLALRMQEWGR